MEALDTRARAAMSSRAISERGRSASSVVVASRMAPSVCALNGRPRVGVTVVRGEVASSGRSGTVIAIQSNAGNNETGRSVSERDGNGGGQHGTDEIGSQRF